MSAIKTSDSIDRDVWNVSGNSRPRSRSCGEKYYQQREFRSLDHMHKTCLKRMDGMQERMDGMQEQINVSDQKVNKFATKIVIVQKDVAENTRNCEDRRSQMRVEQEQQNAKIREERAENTEEIERLKAQLALPLAQEKFIKEHPEMDMLDKIIKSLLNPIFHSFFTLASGNVERNRSNWRDTGIQTCKLAVDNIDKMSGAIAVVANGASIAVGIAKTMTVGIDAVTEGLKSIPFAGIGVALLKTAFVESAKAYLDKKSLERAQGKVGTMRSSVDMDTQVKKLVIELSRIYEWHLLRSTEEEVAKLAIEACNEIVKFMDSGIPNSPQPFHEQWIQVIEDMDIMPPLYAVPKGFVPKFPQLKWHQPKPSKTQLNLDRWSISTHTVTRRFSSDRTYLVFKMLMESGDKFAVAYVSREGCLASGSRVTLIEGMEAKSLVREEMSRANRGGLMIKSAFKIQSILNQVRTEAKNPLAHPIAYNTFGRNSVLVLDETMLHISNLQLQKTHKKDPVLLKEMLLFAKKHEELFTGDNFSHFADSIHGGSYKTLRVKEAINSYKKEVSIFMVAFPPAWILLPLTVPGSICIEIDRREKYKDLIKYLEIVSMAQKGLEAFGEILGVHEWDQGEELPRDFMQRYDRDHPDRGSNNHRAISGVESRIINEISGEANDLKGELDNLDKDILKKKFLDDLPDDFPAARDRVFSRFFRTIFQGMSYETIRPHNSLTWASEKLIRVSEEGGKAMI